MKQFLRHIFLLVAMFMATANAWAECNYDIQNIVTSILTEKKSKKEWWGTDTYYQFPQNTVIGAVNNTYGISKVTATIALERIDAGKNAKVKLEYSINDGEWTRLGSEEELQGTKVAWDTDNKLEISQNVTIPAGSVVRFRVCETLRKEYGSSRKLTISNFSVTMASTLTASPSTLDFGTIEEGQSIQKNFKIAYSNIGGITASSSNSDVFTVSPTSSVTPCGGTETFYVTFNPKESGSYEGKITLSSNANNKVAEVVVTGKATGEPDHQWKGKTAYNVDETIDLSTWYSSNNDGARSYEIVSFSPLDDTGVTPTLNGSTIKLTRAGELTVRMKQAAHGIYSYKESTQTFTISKHNSNFKWNNPDNLQCYVDEFCDEASLFSRSSDIPLTITSSNTNVVNYQDGIFTAVGAGTAVITVKQDKHYKWTEFEETYTIHVNKYDVSATIAQESALWNELINNAFSVSYGLQDYTVTSSNTNIAQYLNGNKIQTYFTSGTVQFRIFRKEDRKYNELNKTFPLEVNPAGGCDVLTTEKNKEYKVGYYDNYSGFDFNLSGVGNTISLEVKRQDHGYGYIYVIGYDASGNNETNIASIKYDEMSDSEWRSKTYTIENENIRKITIRSGHNIWDDALNKYFKNVQVTRKTYLRPSTTELTIPQTNIGKSSENTFNLSWSTCSNDIKLVSNNDLFEVGTTQINTDAHTGTTNNILVRFKGANEQGTYSAVITIYDQSQSKEVHVYCNVKDRLATKIVYAGESQYSEAHDCIENLFSVIDNETGNTITRANIVLTSSNKDILEICGNAGFMPHCGGKVTLAARFEGDETYASAEWSGEITVANCYQTIDWEQDFRQFIAAEDGTISQRIELTAKADPTDFAITYELDEVAQKFARLENQNGQWFLVISGVGTGHIIATSPAGTFETKYYDEARLMHEIRVHKWGEKCNTDSIVTSREVTLSDVLAWWPIETEFELDGRPYARMEFYSHVSNESWYNDLTVSFSTDGGSTWTNSKTFYDIPNTYNWNTPYVHDNIPEGANRVKFRTNSTTNTYFNMVKMVQKTYLEPNVTEIRIDDAIVNKQFSREFKVKYSDIPLLQHVISDSYDLGLKLTSTPPVANDCGDWGEYTFTLTGESPYPQKNVTDTITFYTSARDKVEIPVVITSSLSDTCYFNQQAGNWGDLNNWQVKGATPTQLPTASNPIVISKAMTINEGELVAYGVTINDGGSVNIKPKGGLTLHAGGFADVTEDNFEVHNNLEGAGYVRVSKYFKKLGGTMPKLTVHFTTKANMNNGGNKDAAWQYIGAPGAETQMQVVNTSTLYLRSEEKGWVRQWDSNASLTPFAGYAFTQKDQPSIDFTPRLVTDNQTITLTYTKGGMEGDNLWANSYMAPIDIKKLGKEDFSGNVDQIVYLYNCGSWNEWNKDQSAIQTAEELPGRYYAIPVGSARALDATYDQTVIPPMQGVYMVAPQSGGGSLTLNYEKHVWNCKSNEMNRALRIAGKRTAEEDYLSSILRIRLQINSQNSGADRMYLIQDSTCTANYDNGFDAPKQMTDGLLNLYTNEACGKMEISATDNIDGIYLGFAAGEDEVYTMTFTSLIGEDLYLYDVEQDTLVGMANGETYEFAAAAKSTNDMRFQILVNPDLSDYLPNGGNGDGVTTDIYDVQAQQLWVQDEKVYIAHASANSVLEVYTVSGMPVARYAIGYAPCTLDLSNMPTGVYMLRLNDTVYKFVCN